MKKAWLISLIFSVGIVGLFLYSYTQVDLGLTLSKLSIWQVVEKSFQFIGYFQRPLSTGFYVVLLFVLFGSYIFLLRAAYKSDISRKNVWILIIFTAILLTFAYNAFSYDLFNYIFDAKIVTHYHLNPYQYKALDFPNDPMLSFMHWIERVYPYGPLWLLVTIPFSFLGGGIFLITFYLFKLIGALSYLGTAFFLEKTARRFNTEKSLFALSLFAFSPLVIIEGLVSAHNDMLMIFLSTLALYLIIERRYVVSFVSLIGSMAVKFATIIWLPLWIFMIFKKRQKDYENYMIFGVAISIIPVILATLRTNFQPWYLLYLFPFAGLVKKSFVIVPVIIFSLFALLEYIPFLYTGNWNPPIPNILNQISITGICLSLIVGLILF
ncbi:MAG TPA: hypothetical protein VF189_03640, partial [Patescibacteria group bacterium]